jgi:hypothetical protein
MWKGTDMGTFTGSQFAPMLRSHASGLYRVTPITDKVEPVKKIPSADKVVAVSGGLKVTTHTLSTLPIYLLNGAICKQVNLHTDGTHFIPLSPGQYVVSGQVMCVR